MMFFHTGIFELQAVWVNFCLNVFMKNAHLVISICQLISRDIIIIIYIVFINQFNVLNPDSIYVVVNITPQSVLLIVVTVLNLALSVS